MDQNGRFGWLAAAGLACAGVVVAGAPSWANSCDTYRDQYNALQQMQASMAGRIGPLVFDPIRLRTCPIDGLQYLDSYIAVLRQMIPARQKAYPCGNNAKTTGPDPSQILSQALTLRQGCMRVLNATPSVATAPAPSQGGQRNPPSCSDITGTSNKYTSSERDTPAQTGCKTANREFRIARNFRKDYPALAPERYKKAADLYRAAGDPRQAQMTLWELQAPPIDFPDEDERRLNALREGGSSKRTGQSIAAVNQTCEGIEVAASKYSDAATHFGVAREFDYAEEMARESDRLLALVAQARREGRCAGQQPAAASKDPIDPKKSNGDPPEECQKQQAVIEQLDKLAESMPSLATAGANVLDAPNDAKIEADIKRIELVLSGCPNKEGRTPSRQACERLKERWTKEGKFAAAEIDRRLASGGCK